METLVSEVVTVDRTIVDYMIKDDIIAFNITHTLNDKIKSLSSFFVPFGDTVKYYIEYKDTEHISKIYDKYYYFDSRIFEQLHNILISPFEVGLYDFYKHQQKMNTNCIHIMDREDFTKESIFRLDERNLLVYRIDKEEPVSLPRYCRIIEGEYDLDLAQKILYDNPWVYNVDRRKIAADGISSLQSFDCLSFIYRAPQYEYKKYFDICKERSPQSYSTIFRNIVNAQPVFIGYDMMDLFGLKEAVIRD